MSENFDILLRLTEVGLEPVSQKILEYLDLVDLKCCQLVSKNWNSIVERLYDHHEWLRVGWGWSFGQPKVISFQCLRERSVCTVTSLALDERSLVCALGTSGNIELWDRRELHKNSSAVVSWRVLAHQDGVYALDMNHVVVVSCGQEEVVKVWHRANGELLTKVLHDFFLGNVRLWVDKLTTFCHDGTVRSMRLKFEDNEISVENLWRVTGPLEWSEALACDYQGRYLVTADEETFEIGVWNLSDFQEPVRLEGHTDEVHCAKFLLPYLATAGSDKTVRIWKLQFSDKSSNRITGGYCVRKLSGHEGKIWCIDLDRKRIVAGGRFGEIRVWSLADVIDWTKDDEDCAGRSIWCYGRSTSVGQIWMERALLVACDGLGHISFLDFWNIEKSDTNCACQTIAPQN